MDGRHSRLTAVSLALLAIVVAGCAQRPGAGTPDPHMTAGASAHAAAVDPGPMPVADPGTNLGTNPGTMTSGSSVAYGRGERPAPADFTSIADLVDIHFDFDRADIRSDAAEALAATARWLKAHPDRLILIEGHTDERGSNEYNVALGDQRAKSSMNYLVSHGIKASRITIVSYGEDRPACEMHSEACWQRNRRAHFAVRSQ